MAVQHVMYQLFCNSLNEPEICWSSHNRRPKNMKCNDFCKMYSAVSIPFYNVFGKVNIMHSIVCTKHMINDELWNLTNTFINYRLKLSEDYDGDGISKSHLRSLHNRYKNSIARGTEQKNGF